MTDPKIDRTLAAALGRWRWIRFGTGLALVAGATSLAALVLGLAMWRGLLTDAIVAGAVAALVVLGGAAGLLAALLVTVLTRQPRGWLAGRVEDASPELLDRLNTLVWLDERRDPDLAAYRDRIEVQAARRLFYGVRAAIPTRARNRACLGAVLVIVSTVAFFVRVRPWTRLSSPMEATADHPSSAESKLALPAPDDAAEVKRTWGEVRITEPGHDLKVTKVDVVPLQIEAAATDALLRTHWVTAVGGRSSTHELPAPSDPHYAVYRPMLYVDELRLSDWDVVAYHAATQTDHGASYASDLHFLEVRPFRQDILKMPGGEGGEAYQLLGELSGLIDRQKHIVRETHLFGQRSYATEALRRQDRDKLATAERELAEASRHLYARIAARMENADVGVVLDNLARAREQLGAAAGALGRDDARAPEHERDALTSLVATRKHLQKAINENPGAFGGDRGDDGDEPTPVVGLDEKLARIAEFRDAGKAARTLLDEAARRQKQLAAEASRQPAKEHPELAEKQAALRREVKEFVDANPEVFKSAERERAAADDAMQESASALSQQKPGAAGACRRAVGAVEGLRDAVSGSADARQLGQAYELEKALAEQARALKHVEEHPDADPGAPLGPLAERSKRALRELEHLVKETPAGDAFGPPLHDALGAAEQEERERRLDALPRAEPGEPRRKAARGARSALEQLGQAFERSEPRLTRELRKSDPLGEKGSEAFDRALRALEGLVARGEQGRGTSSDDAARHRREILLALERGARERYGRDPQLMLLLKEAEKQLARADLRIDAVKLRRLMEEIEQFRAENAEERTASGDPELRHVDVSRLPPAYRERLERYYRQLSEQR